MSLFEKRKPKTDFSKLKSLMHGNPKVGKTTAYSTIPGLVYIATERGHNFIEGTIADVFSWEDVRKVGAELIKSPPEDVTGVVIDTVNNLVDMAEKSYCQEHSIAHLSEHAFGKGYNGVKEMVMNFLNALEKAGLSIHMIAHSKEKEIKSKTRSETIVQPNLSQGMMDSITGFVDLIFFAYIDEEGKRVMRTKPTRNIVAGDRSAKLPDLMPLDMSLVQKYMIETKGENK